MEKHTHTHTKKRNKTVVYSIDGSTSNLRHWISFNTNARSFKIESDLKSDAFVMNCHRVNIVHSNKSR